MVLVANKCNNFINNNEKWNQLIYGVVVLCNTSLLTFKLPKEANKWNWAAIEQMKRMAVRVTNARLIAAGDRGKLSASLMGDGRWWHSTFAEAAALADASALYSCNVHVGPSTENEDDFNRGTNLSNYYHYHRRNVNSKYKWIESKRQDRLSKQRGEENDSLRDANKTESIVRKNVIIENCVSATRDMNPKCPTRFTCTRSWKTVLNLRTMQKTTWKLRFAKALRQTDKTNKLNADANTSALLPPFSGGNNRICNWKIYTSHFFSLSSSLLLCLCRLFSDNVPPRRANCAIFERPRWVHASRTVRRHHRRVNLGCN